MTTRSQTPGYTYSTHNVPRQWPDVDPNIGPGTQQWTCDSCGWFTQRPLGGVCSIGEYEDAFGVPWRELKGHKELCTLVNTNHSRNGCGA